MTKGRPRVHWGSCLIEGCERLKSCRDWCNRHYLRWYRHGDPEGGIMEWMVQAPERLPTTHEIWWIAAFLEGEGSFRGPKSIRVDAAQKQLWPLKKLQKLLGGSIYNRDSYGRWAVHGKTAANLMWSLYSLMSPRRREQIEVALGFPVTS